MTSADVDALSRQRRDGRRARAFRDEVLELDETGDRGCEIVLADGDDPIDGLLDDGERDRFGIRIAAETICERRARDDFDEPSCAHAGQKRARRCGFDADDLAARRDRLRGDGHAADQSAAADGDDDGDIVPRVGRILEQLQSNRPGTGDHVGIVVG